VKHRGIQTAITFAVIYSVFFTVSGNATFGRYSFPVVCSFYLATHGFCRTFSRLLSPAISWFGLIGAELDIINNRVFLPLPPNSKKLERPVMAVPQANINEFFICQNRYVKTARKNRGVT